MITPNNNYNGLVLSREEVRRCDRIAIEQYEINGLVLMENAGIGAAREVFSMLENPQDRVCILAGPGNNGGDGYVVARHILNTGGSVRVLLCCQRSRIKGDALSNLVILEHMAAPIIHLPVDNLDKTLEICAQELNQSNLIVDALLGTGTSGPPREPIRSIIELVNQVSLPVLALDIPSGLDCDTGEVLGTAIRARRTVTFAAMKKGFLQSHAQPYTGLVQVVSIGIDARLLT
jgi:NAD(P)H-hydrate epimerase